MKMKILLTDNFSHTYLLYREEEDLMYLIDQQGELKQIKRGKLSIDKTIEVPVAEVYKKFENPLDHFYQRAQLLKLCSHWEREMIAKQLKIDFSHYKNSNICYQGNDQLTRLCLYYADYDLSKNRCEIEIFQHQIQFLQGEGKGKKNDLNKQGIDNREIVVFIFEEFGNYYISGKDLRNYLGQIPADIRGGKKYWTMQADYQQLLRVKGAVAFDHYSNQFSQFYHHKINSKAKEKNQSGPHSISVSGGGNGMDSFRQVSQMMTEIKTKKLGYKVSGIVQYQDKKKAA